MTELRLGHSQDRDYGVTVSGEITYGSGIDRIVPVTVRRPAELHGDEPLIVLAQGLTMGPESMSIAAREAVRYLGGVAVTLHYSNTSTNNPLDKNADDLLAVTDAFSNLAEFSESSTAFYGWSEGGAVSTMAAARQESPVSALYLNSPAGFIHGLSRERRAEVMSAFARQGVSDVLASAREITTRPHVAALTLRSIGRVVGDFRRNCQRRPKAVVAELLQLIDERRFDELAAYRTASPDSRVVVAWSSDDILVPGDLLLESFRAEEEDRGQKLVTRYMEYRGGHNDIMRYPELTRRILSDDDTELDAA